ncbi:MAG: PorT family protein [Paludibacteraceae bacterium]|nr:PorT family protein [Paludibacteraceae bacterium]
MKKIFISLLVTLFAFTANAQLSPYSPFTVFDGNHYWVEAGASYNKVKTRHTDYKLGYRGGVGADIPIHYSTVSFLPSIVFECKGYTQEMIVDMAPLTTDMTSMYIEAPINFSYNLAIGKKTGIQFCAGPYFAVGIAGSYTESSDNYLGLYGTRSLDFNPFKNDDPEHNLLRRFDFGADLGIRIIFLRHAMVKLNAELGCINISGKEGVPGFRNVSLSGSLAFRY